MIINIEHTDQFFNCLQEHVQPDDYRYKFLSAALTGAFGRAVGIDAKSFFHQTDDGWLLFIELGMHLFMYGENYSATHIAHLIDAVDFKKCKGFEIMGSKDLVYTVLQSATIDNYTLIKDRCFYKLSHLAVAPTKKGITTAKVEDRTELTQMFQGYYAEEYQGENNKDTDTLFPRIERLIREQSLFVLRIHKTITSFCSVINPNIGILFTKQNHQRHRYAFPLFTPSSPSLYPQHRPSHTIPTIHHP